LINSENFAYDNGGNPDTYKGDTLVWAGKRLASYTTSGGVKTSFTYNEDGLRTSKTSGGVTTNYYYNGTLLMGLEEGTLSGSTFTAQKALRFSYDSGGNVIAVGYANSPANIASGDFWTFYYLRNGQGDIVKIIDGNGETLVEYAYDTWGKLLSTVATPTTTYYSTGPSSTCENVARMNPFRYRGYVYDSSTKLYYCQSRYLDPQVGRFISADALLSTGQGVLGYNMYCYSLNNPVNLKDSAGNRSFSTMETDSGGSSAPPPWEFLRHPRYDTAEEAAEAWANGAIIDTQRDHRERGAIILSEEVDGKTQYYTGTTFVGNNDTCWQGFVANYLVDTSLSVGIFGSKVEGFVHTHTAYPPEGSRTTWNVYDYGPSDSDLGLFVLPGIKKQFLINESGYFYEFYKDIPIKLDDINPPGLRSR